MSPKLHRIIIIGAGFAGLRVALELCKRRARLRGFEIVLIDRESRQTYSPLLYEVASGGIGKGSSSEKELEEFGTIPLDAHPILQKYSCVTVRKGEVIEIDSSSQEVKFKGGEKLAYNDLVVAVGSVSNFYKIPGAAEFAIPLKTLSDAKAIRDRIREKCRKQSSPKIVIVGGGSTGTELSAELAGACRVAGAESPSIILVETGKQILAAYSDSARQQAQKRLGQMGVEVRKEASVVRVEKEGVFLSEDEFLPADIVVWAAGNASHPLLRQAGFSTDKHGFVRIESSLQIKDQLHVFALGDCSVFMRGNSKERVPALAQVAIRQAPIVAENIARKLERKKLTTWKPPAKWITIVPLGGCYAIADFGFFQIGGRAGHWLRILVDLMYLFSVLPAKRAMRRWMRMRKIFSKNDLKS